VWTKAEKMATMGASNHSSMSLFELIKSDPNIKRYLDSKRVVGIASNDDDHAAPVVRGDEKRKVEFANQVIVRFYDGDLIMTRDMHTDLIVTMTKKGTVFKKKGWLSMLFTSYKYDDVDEYYSQ
jgi:hypothetical protein